MPMKQVALGIVIVPAVLTAGCALFVWSGVYDVAADRPHMAFTHMLLETMRDRSIAVRAKAIEAQNLDDPARIAEGAEHYAAMCADCHLAPGIGSTEIRTGLYPQSPDLAEHGIHDPAQAFWVIKHGVKATAMPAWGKTHSDEEIWNLVAFVRGLPRMSPQEYRTMTRRNDSPAGPPMQPDIGKNPSIGEPDPHEHRHDRGRH